MLDDNFHKKVDKLLEELTEKWKAKLVMDYAMTFFTNTRDETQTAVEEIIEKTIRSFKETNYDRQRYKNREEGREEVINVIEVMKECKEKFEQAAPVVIDEEDKTMCETKSEECDELMATWLAMYDDQVDTALQSDEFVSYEETTTLLEQYHQFSVDVASVVNQVLDENRNPVAPTDPGSYSTDYRVVKSRLDELAEALKLFYESERDLRKQVQEAVDQKFDEENMPGSHWYKANYDA